MAYEYVHCPDCLTSPVYVVQAGEPPETHARLPTCADEHCLKQARCRVEQATGLDAEVAAIDVAEVA